MNNQDRKIEITWTKDAIQFAKKKDVSHILFVVDSTVEQCLEIYDPKVKMVRGRRGEKNRETLQKLFKTPSEIHPLEAPRPDNRAIEISFYDTEMFKEKFGMCLAQPITIELHGSFKKKLRIREIEPILINICKVD